ncbi:hypothetical protein AHF37_05367 [Paragonimus kellicotti]|nr:hypothetical protein AHF37_05367 [Paragonimus kellicotti]
MLAIDIDLGTTTCIAVCTNSEPEVLPNSLGQMTTPSYVATTEDNGILQDCEHWSFWIVEVGSKLKSADGNRTLEPEAVASHLLSELKENASYAPGKNVTDAVITIPAYFNNIQRDATKLSVHMSGLNTLHIINEQTSA